MSDAAAQIDQALRSLRSGRLLLEDGDSLGAVNRLYYALYHAACAALLHRRLPVPKTHSGLISSFGATFVKSGEISAELGKLLNQAEHERLSADYTGDAVDADAIPALLDKSDVFIATIRTLIGHA